MQASTMCGWPLSRLSALWDDCASLDETEDVVFDSLITAAAASSVANEQ
jgi:hypothetical protein